MKTLLRGLLMTLALFLLLGTGHYFFNLREAGTRVRALCAQITPGMGLESLQALARQHGLGPRLPREGLQYLVETRSFGRHGCRVLVKAGVVEESVYNVAD